MIDFAGRVSERCDTVVPSPTYPPRRLTRGRPAPASARPVQADRYPIRPRAVWDFFKKQPLAFQLACLYVMCEYVRPQQIYDPLAGLPIASLSVYAGLLAVLFGGGSGRKWNAADTSLAVFSGVVLLSIFTAYSPAYAMQFLSLYISWVLIYIIISCAVKNERQFMVFMLLYLLYSFKMSQHGARTWVGGGFAFRSWGTTCAPGWFQNSGECGIQMAVFLPVAIYFILGLRDGWGKWTKWFFYLLPITAILTMIGTSSRGALLGLGAIALWMALISRQRVKALSMVFALAVIVYMLTPPEQKLRFSGMGEDTTSTSRLVYWERAREIMMEHPVLGIGYYNWLPYYRINYDPYGELVHNIFYQAGAELGFVGLAAFLGMIGVTFALNLQTRRLARELPGGGKFLSRMAFGLDGALIGFMVTGFFVTVLYYPFFWINLAMTSALYSSTLAETAAYRAARARMRPANGAVNPNAALNGPRGPRMRLAYDGP